jgi:hypothetical protein
VQRGPYLRSKRATEDDVVAVLFHTAPTLDVFLHQVAHALDGLLHQEPRKELNPGRSPIFPDESSKVTGRRFFFLPCDQHKTGYVEIQGSAIQSNL